MRAWRLSAGPRPRPCRPWRAQPAADLQHGFVGLLGFGSFHYDQWLAAYDGFRAAAARLIGATPEEIAIVKNTSEGIATVQLGFDWKPGDALVAFREEFPANYFPWKLLEQRGIDVRWLSIHDPLDRIEGAARGARLLAISWVNYLSGHRVDLEAIGQICQKENVFFFVDAIQGLGVFPLDVNACHIDALAADGHKWLLGPEGCGVLYLRREWQDRIFPMEFGWTNIAGFNDYACRDLTLRPDAGRYECGTLNTIGIFGLWKAMEFLLEVGPASIAPALLDLTARTVAGVRAKGYEVLGEPNAGITSFRKEGIDSRLIVRNLKDQNILAAPRQGWVRTSPHFYISPDDIDRLVAALP